ncbi:MAG TPA: ATP-binding protein [Candidatus Saccharimonadales bacterium]|nr:ATP-binding protein [Candidatus Saccharimonadales bacterium]
MIASLIPVLLLGFYATTKTSQTTQNAALETNHIISQQASLQADVFLANVEKTIEAISDRISNQTGIDNTNGTLEYYHDNFTIFNTPVFESFVMLDKNGAAITVAPFNEAFVGYDYSRQDFFRRAVDTRSSYFSPGVDVSKVTKKPIVRIAVPKMENGDVAFVLVADVSLEGITRLSNQIKVGKTGFAFIVDEKGTIIAHPNEDFVNQQQNISNIYSGVTTTTLAEHPGFIKWPESKTQVFLNPSRLQNVGWFVVFKQDNSEIFALTNSLRTQLILLFLATLSFISASTFVISRQIVKPIKLVHDAFERFGMGDLKARVKVQTRDEIEDLANGFNAMAQNLEESLSVISAERNKLSLTISSIVDAIVAIDYNRNIIIFNKAAELLTGIKNSDAIGKPINQIIELYDKEILIPDSVYCPLDRNIEEGILFSHNNLKLAKRDGKEAYVNVTSGCIREGRVTNLACILTMHDITAEIDLERMKMDFISIAAHQLRTPLTAIKGYLSMLSGEVRNKLTDQEGLFLTRIDLATQRLLTLVQNLLSVTKVERGVFRVEMGVVDIASLVEKTVDEFVDRAKFEFINLTYKKPTTPIPNVIADSLGIHEVLSNLISNAIDYNKPEGKIEVSLEVVGEMVNVYVTDNGVGIPKDAIPKLFTKFYQVSGPMRIGSTAKGSGLGLYISKAVIEAHKGNIWVDSEYDKGSTFAFSLHIHKPGSI